jgi:pimeloyl-ACP methyl ester carboxylesterase
VLAVDPPIVLEQYDKLIGLLKRDFRVLVFELPGFGFSIPSASFRFDFFMVNDMIAKFLRELQLGPYILAFPCASAYGAIDIAARFPDLVSHVAMVQAPSWPEEVKWKHGRDKTGLLSRPVIGQLALQVLKRKRAPLWLDLAVGNRSLLPNFVATTDHAFSLGASFCLASAFQHYLTDAPQPLSAVKQPSLIIWGDADKSHDHTDKASSKTLCPGADVVHMAHAGHFPELEQPEFFAAKLNEWVYSTHADSAPRQFTLKA